MSTTIRRALTVLLLSCVAAVSGCKAMTTEQQVAKDKIAEKEAEAARLAELENQKEIEKLEREKHAAKLEVERLKQERDRGIYMQNAAAELSAGNTEAALDILSPMIESDGVVAVESMQTYDGETAFTKPWNDQQRAFGYLIAGVSHYQIASFSDPVDTERQRRAAAMVTTAVERDPNSREAREALATIHFSLQDYARALIAIQKDFEAGFRSTKLLFLAARARYFLAQERQDVNGSPDRSLLLSARKAIEEAFVADPSNDELREWRLLLAKELGEWDTALAEIDAILSANPYDKRYMDEKLNVLLNLDRYEEAIDLLEQWDKIDPLPGKEARYLGDLYAQVGLYSRAADWYVKGYGDDIAAVDPVDLYRVGSSLARAGSVQRGQKWLENVPSNAEIYPDALLELAYLAESQRDAMGAIRHYQAHLGEKPDNFRAWYSLGELLRGEDRLEDAQAAYVKASSHEETAARGFVGLAECAYERGQLDEAIQKYSKAVELAPDAAQFRRALQEITQEKIVKQQAEQAKEKNAGAR